MLFFRINYINTKPSFVRTVNFIPTGKDKRAEIRAMCCFPSPLAIERATSMPLILFFIFFEISSLRSMIEPSLISMNSKSFLLVNCFAELSPKRIMLSQSP